MKGVALILLCLAAQGLSFGQSYTTDQDTFYVQTPEYSVSLGLDSLHFPCAITTPDVGSNFPVLILVHGTAALDMDANSTKDFLDSIGAPFRKAETRMFYEIADSLSRNGILVLRYDKRSFTVNCIETPACWFVDTISPYDYITDIHGAIDFAKRIPNVDTCNIFLAGHSQGGSFVSQVAYDRIDVRGVLNMAGTAIPVDSVAVHQEEFINNDPNGAAILRQQFDSLRMGLWPLGDTLYNHHFSPQFWLDWISHTDSALIVQQTSDKPTALMYGTADKFAPASIHYQIWQDSVTRPDVTFQLFNDIDHGFGSEFDSIMSPQVLGFMADWIHNTSMPSCGPNSILENNRQGSLSVYPNPSNNRVTVRLSYTGRSPFLLLDVDGKTLMQGVVNGQRNTELDMTQLKPGLYFLHVGASAVKVIKN